MMETRFGKFITNKAFPKLFMLLYAVSVFFTAYITDRAISRVFSIRTYGAAYIFYVLAAVLAMAQKSVGKRWPDKGYKVAVSVLSCFLIYNLFFLVLWEIIALLFRTDEIVEAMGAMVCAGLAVMTVLYGYLHTKAVACATYTIALGEKGAEYRIALLSDIHLGVFVGPKHVKKVVDAVNALVPDLVVIAGDILDVDNDILTDSAKLAEISGIFRNIKSRDGVYAVLGNHDPNVADERLTNFLQEAQIHLLHNETLQFPQINLIGRTDAANNIRKPMERLIHKIDGAKPVVVLDHDPQNIREAAAYGVDLVLCGHTHRGQFFPITLFTKWANGKHYFYGHEIFGKTHGIITSGAGFFQLPVRIGTSNEVVDIHLKLAG